MVTATRRTSATLRGLLNAAYLLVTHFPIGKVLNTTIKVRLIIESAGQFASHALNCHEVNAEYSHHILKRGKARR